MSLTYFGSKENKENHYAHEMQSSPQRSGLNPRNRNLQINYTNEPTKKWKEEDIVSPTLLKQRKQLVELCLNRVSNLNTSLELMVDDHPC